MLPRQSILILSIKCRSAPKKAFALKNIIFEWSLHYHSKHRSKILVIYIKPTCSGEEIHSAPCQSWQFYPCICEWLHHCSIQQADKCLETYILGIEIILIMICIKLTNIFQEHKAKGSVYSFVSTTAYSLNLKDILTNNATNIRKHDQILTQKHEWWAMLSKKMLHYCPHIYV